PLPAGPDGNRLDDRHTDRPGETPRIDSITSVAREVAHIECDDHRAPEALEIEHETQAQSQIRGIDHTNDEVRGLLRSVPPEHDVARDRLIEGRGLEAVGSGQIEHAV